jgi:hypothetical protein
MKRLFLLFVFAGALFADCDSLSSSLYATGTSATVTNDGSGQSCTSFTLRVLTTPAVNSYTAALQGNFGSGFTNIGNTTCSTLGTCMIFYTGTAPNTLRVNMSAFNGTGYVSFNLSGAGAVSPTDTVAGVNYPANPATNTVPVITSPNNATYEKVPNAALLNPSVTVNGVLCTLGSTCGQPAANNPPPAFSQTTTVTVTGVTSATTLLGAGSGSLTLPANFFSAPGSILRVKGQGFYNQNADVTAFTLILSMGGTTLFSAPLGPTAATGNFEFFFDIVLTAQTVGASGGIIGNGNVTWDNTAAAPNRMKFIMTSPVTIDTTATQLINLTITPGAAAQSFSLTNFVLAGY